MDLSKTDLLPFLTFKTSRSGGKGGQHVNKVSSKVELNFDYRSAHLFTEEQKAMLAEKLANRMNSDGHLQVVSSEERSQHLNKERALEKLYFLLKKALVVQKVRKATKPRKSSIEQRLKEKQIQALKKLSRRKDFDR